MKAAAALSKAFGIDTYATSEVTVLIMQLKGSHPLPDGYIAHCKGSMSDAYLAWQPIQSPEHDRHVKVRAARCRLAEERWGKESLFCW